MNYSLSEFLRNIEEKLKEIGFNPTINGAIPNATVMGTIAGLIEETNPTRRVIIFEGNGVISFEYKSKYDDKCTMMITSPNKETITCIKTKEREPLVKLPTGEFIKEKLITELVIEYDENTGEVTIIKNNSLLDNIDSGKGKCHNSNWSEREVFTKYGIMKEKEYKCFPRKDWFEDFSKVTIDLVLSIPRKSYDENDYWNSKHNTRLLLVRDNIDTAKILYEDKTKGIRHTGIIPIDTKDSLIDLIPEEGTIECPQNVIIKELSSEQIEFFISRINREDIREGLKEFAKERNFRYYNDTEDKYFDIESKSLTKKLQRILENK